MLWNFTGLQCICGVVVHNEKCALGLPDNCPAELMGEFSMSHFLFELDCIILYYLFPFFHGLSVFYTLVLFKVTQKMKTEISSFISEQLANEPEWNYLVPGTMLFLLHLFVFYSKTGLPKSERVEIIDTLYTAPTVAWVIDFGEFYICYNKSQQIKVFRSERRPISAFCFTKQGLLAFISPNTNLNVQYSSMSALWALPKLGVLGLPKVLLSQLFNL
jgi:hypothetical protein